MTEIQMKNYHGTVRVSKKMVDSATGESVLDQVYRRVLLDRAMSNRHLMAAMYFSYKNPIWFKKYDLDKHYDEIAEAILGEAVQREV